MRLVRLLLFVAAVVAVCATPASGDVAGRKQTIDSRLARVQAKIAWAEERERTLAGQIAEVNGQIRGSRNRSASSRRSSGRSSATSRCTRRNSTG
jgi:hypothetical protein